MINRDAFVTMLQSTNRRLSHFTDSRNIDNIRKYGLLPTRALHFLGIDTIYGGDEASLHIDSQKGFDGYVRVSFCRKHPMSHDAVKRGSILDVRILRICPTVLLRDGVLIADRVATAHGAVIDHPDVMINKMDFEATFRYLDWNIPENHARRLAAEKWEALIPTAIEPALIYNL